MRTSVLVALAVAMTATPAISDEMVACKTYQAKYSGPNGSQLELIKVGRLDHTERCPYASDVVAAKLNGRKVIYNFLPMQCGDFDFAFEDSKSAVDTDYLHYVSLNTKWTVVNKGYKAGALKAFTISDPSGKIPSGEYRFQECSK